MNLQQNVASCNKKYTDYAIAARYSSDSDEAPVKRSGSFSTEFLDATQNRKVTKIAIDNALVFGGNPSWNQELAVLVQLAFSKAEKLSQLISVPKFFAMSVAERRDPKISYIITCDDLGIEAAKLSELNSFVSTVCSFKIPGLDWKFGEYGKFEISARAQDILDALNITKQIPTGLLASLGDREFCFISQQNLFKGRV